MGVSEAQAELERITSARAALTQKLEDYAAKIQAARDLAAEALLDAQLSGGVGEGYAGAVTLLEAERETVQAAIAQADDRIAAAQRAVKVAQAAEWRAQAAGLRAEAEKRQKKTDKLIAELAVWEGVEFEPKTLARDPATGTVWRVGTGKTISDTLRDQAAGLEHQAHQLELALAGKKM